MNRRQLNRRPRLRPDALRRRAEIMQALWMWPLILGMVSLVGYAIGQGATL